MMKFSDYLRSFNEGVEEDKLDPKNKKWKSNKLDSGLGDLDECDECGDLGLDKIVPPDAEGFDASITAARAFVGSPDEDDNDIDASFNNIMSNSGLDDFGECKECKESVFMGAPEIDQLPIEKKRKLREAAEYILSVLDEEDYAINGENDDDHIDDSGLDLNTVPAYPEEKDQFSNVDGLSDELVDNDIEESGLDIFS